MLSEAFKTYARLLRQLHAFIRDGAGDSDEADAVRDRMDRPWAMMPPPEQELTRFLSADLYDLAAVPRQHEAPRTPAQSAALTAIANASRNGNYDFVLRNIR